VRWRWLDRTRAFDVSGEPMLLGREVCTAAFQGRAACYEAQSGNRWARDMSTLTGMSIDALRLRRRRPRLGAC
jgi:outer membrane protein assembly factor BamB